MLGAFSVKQRWNFDQAQSERQPARREVRLGGKLHAAQKTNYGWESL